MEKQQASHDENPKKKRKVVKVDDPLPEMLPMTLEIVSMLTDETHTCYTKSHLDDHQKLNLQDTNYLFEQFNHAQSEQAKDKMIKTVLQLKTVVGQLSLMCKKIKDKKSVSTLKTDFSTENEIDRQALKNLESKLEHLADYKVGMIRSMNGAKVETVQEKPVDDLCDDYDQNTDEVVGMIQSVEQE
jgi:CRISPR/Cas system CSM-associated protein Csm3 (group 7 of RAMP superfamily)